MKRMIRSLTLAAALSGLGLLSTLPGFGQTPRFYVNAGVGPAFTMDTSLREFNAPVSGAKVKFDPGVQFRFAAGFLITEWLATELETGVTYNSIKSITGAVETDASLLNAPLLANLVVQCPRKSRFVPFIGGGLGGSSAVLDAHDIVRSDGNGNFVRLSGTASEAVFAYQGFAGLRYRINERMGVSLSYRYFGTTAPTWEADLTSFSGTGKVRFGDNQTHSVIAAFTYDF